MNTEKYARYRQVFLQNHGILRASQAEQLGVPRYSIRRMHQKGLLVREGPGLYRLAEMEPLSDPDLIQVSLLVPRAVICLISALFFYDMTDEIPHQIYIALPRDTKAPRVEYPPLKVFHFGGHAYSSGIEEYTLDGVKVRIYSREKTIADCFKYRQKLGITLAIEALKSYMQRPDADLNKIMQYAKIDRVQNSIRPYIETLL